MHHFTALGTSRNNDLTERRVNSDNDLAYAIVPVSFALDFMAS